MKKGITFVQIFYFALLVSLLGSFAYTQSRGLRLLNVFSTGISSHAGPGSPNHK